MACDKLSEILVYDCMKDVMAVVQNNWSELNTWVLATVNLTLSFFGAYLAVTITQREPAPVTDPEINGFDSKTLNESEPKPKPKPWTESLVLHFGTLIGSIGFLLSAFLNFSSVFLRYLQKTGQTSDRFITLMATLWLCSTGQGGVVGELGNSMTTATRTQSPVPIAGPVQLFNGIYIISGTLNVVALVGMYRWWKMERRERCRIRMTVDLEAEKRG
ncbi:hypothetical protein GYMLUDRAFT_76254 [Collybiopsis luxurians FD-317 M1]|uniref:Uncharacterized protein n=1 Tax=Collybiopsis luxurians FD-317 M1 TaxID=944289 RepID=A0A0D0CLS9_9AGAR|nr:hypothetical protein GYMLUDRAFT_76254 [Collybiopsis luxurians FD-317 M1]